MLIFWLFVGGDLVGLETQSGGRQTALRELHWDRQDSWLGCRPESRHWQCKNSGMRIGLRKWDGSPSGPHGRLKQFSLSCCLPAERIMPDESDLALAHHDIHGIAEIESCLLQPLPAQSNHRHQGIATRSRLGGAPTFTARQGLGGRLRSDIQREFDA